MVEKRTVGIILAMILVVVVAAYFIFKVLGLQPEKDIFPKDKDMLVRYYACSLAICTHGCDWLETNKICLDNDTFTHECNLWCHDVCVERFGDCDDEDRRCCGPEYNLTVSLVGNPLLGCYPHYGPPPIRAKKNEGHSDIYNHWYTVYGSGEKTFYDKLIETEGVPKIIGPPDESILKEGCKRKLGCSGDALYMHFPGQLRTGDEHFVYCSGDKAGIGHIFLDPLEAHEKFGCFGDCSMALAGGDRNSFDECRFQGEINMWADWEDDQCADVYFNSTISGGWDFFITCTDPINPPPDWCKQRINLGETSDPYTIVIDNQLGSGKKFILQVSDNQGGEANCILWKDDPSEEIDRIFVGNGETEEFYMSCTPIETGTYSIWIDAWPRIGYTGKQTQVELVASDFSWEVEPKGDQPPIRKDDSKRYTVEIDSGMGVDTDFVLSLNVPGGLTCKFDENDDVTYTLSIPDDGFDSTTFTCSGDPGEYDIVIRAEGGGINKPPKTRHLTIVLCGGAMDLALKPDSVAFGDPFIAEAFGLEGCEGLIEFAVNNVFTMGYCTITEGSGCELSYSAEFFPTGNHKIYALFEDIDGDGERESASATLKVSSPDYILKYPLFTYVSWYEEYGFDYYRYGDCGDCNAIGDCADQTGCSGHCTQPDPNCPPACPYFNMQLDSKKCNYGNPHCYNCGVENQPNCCSYETFNYMPDCSGCQGKVYCEFNIGVCYESGWECPDDYTWYGWPPCSCELDCGADDRCDGIDPYTFYDTDDDGFYDIYCDGNCQKRP